MCWWSDKEMLCSSAPPEGISSHSSCVQSLRMLHCSAPSGSWLYQRGTWSSALLHSRRTPLPRGGPLKHTHTQQRERQTTCFCQSETPGPSLLTRLTVIARINTWLLKNVLHGGFMNKRNPNQNPAYRMLSFIGVDSHIVIIIVTVVWTSLCFRLSISKTLLPGLKALPNSGLLSLSNCEKVTQNCSSVMQQMQTPCFPKV